MTTVSVLIPCHNAAPYIGAALDSVLAQTWRPLEVIVVDDGSTDGSAAVVEGYASYGVRLIRQVNKGAPAARNSALSRASGHFALFLDADDYLQPRFVELQALEALRKRCDLVFGAHLMTWPDGRAEIERHFLSGVGALDEALALVLGPGWYPPCAILWRTAFLRSIGGWSGFRRNEDGELVARALLVSDCFSTSTGACAVYRQHESPARVSAQKDEAALAANLAIGSCLAERLKSREDLIDSKRALGRAMAELAREAFECECTAIGRKALVLSRALGFKGNPGNRLHQLASFALGLERKTALASRLRRFRW